MLVIGMISGTSADAIEVAACEGRVSYDRDGTIAAMGAELLAEARAARCSWPALRKPSPSPSTVLGR